MERRAFLHIATAVAALALFGRVPLRAEDEDDEAMELPFKEAYEDATEGAKKILKNAKELRLTIPDAPENGLVVPIEVEVDYPMQEEKFIEQITVLTTKNKVNKVVVANYTPANGKAYLFVNAKLGSTQEVVVLARTNDGVIFEGRKKIKVALGGCG